MPLNISMAALLMVVTSVIHAGRMMLKSAKPQRRGLGAWFRKKSLYWKVSTILLMIVAASDDKDSSVVLALKPTIRFFNLAAFRP